MPQHVLFEALARHLRRVSGHTRIDDADIVQFVLQDRGVNLRRTTHRRGRVSEGHDGDRLSSGHISGVKQGEWREQQGGEECAFHDPVR